MNAPAQLDNLNRAREDEDMDNANDTLRSEMGNGFRETNARIDIMYRESNQRLDLLRRSVDENIAELRREVNERINELRREVSARIDRSDDRFEQHRREMQENFRLIKTKIDQVRSNVDVHFRWLVGLMLTSMLGIATLLVKVV
jgi:chromosome segregation ATPase